MCQNPFSDVVDTHLVGADGVHSTILSAIGLSFPTESILASALRPLRVLPAWDPPSRRRSTRPTPASGWFALDRFLPHTCHDHSRALSAALTTTGT